MIPKPTADVFRRWLQVRYAKKRTLTYYDWRAQEAAANE